MFFWWGAAARRIAHKDPVYIRRNGTVYRFVDEESVEPVYLENEIYPYLDADGYGKNGAFREMPEWSSKYSQNPMAISASPPQLPKWAEQLVLLIFPKESREYLIGDLAEEYAEIAAKHGRRFANFWYWKQVAASAWPFLKKALRWGLLTSAWEWVRRLI